MSSTPTDFGSNGPRSRDPEDIARAIDETRSEVDETLDALQARLSPGQVLDRAMELVRANGGQFAGNLGRTVRDNPWPVLLTGVGLAWMMASTRSGAAASARPSGGGGVGEVGEGVSEASARLSGAASEALGESRHRVASAAQYASAAASDTAHRVSDGLANAATLVRDQSQRMSEGLSDLLRDQPLLVGAVGVALGALLGYVLPATEAENRLVAGATRAARAPPPAAPTTRDDARDTPQTASMARGTSGPQSTNATRSAESAGRASTEDDPSDRSVRPSTAGSQDPLGDHEAQSVSDST